MTRESNAPAPHLTVKATVSRGSAVTRLRAAVPYLTIALVMPGGMFLVILFWLSRYRGALQRPRDE